MKNKKKYYSYFLPEENKYGIVNTWEECSNIVNHKSRARFKVFKTQEESKLWLEKVIATLSDKKPIRKYINEYKGGFYTGKFCPKCYNENEEEFITGGTLLKKNGIWICSNINCNFKL